MKGSTVPHLPRRHFRSYGHLPMPFSSLNQDSCSPLCPGSTPCAAPPGAGAVMVQEPQASLLSLRKHSSGDAVVGLNSKWCICTRSFKSKSLGWYSLFWSPSSSDWFLLCHYLHFSKLLYKINNGNYPEILMFSLKHNVLEKSIDYFGKQGSETVCENILSKHSELLTCTLLIRWVL